MEGEPSGAVRLRQQEGGLNAPLFIIALYSLWLFHLHSAVKIQPFSPVFPLAGSTAKAFFRLSLWSFKEKSVNHFLWHSFFQIFILNWLCLSLWLIQDSNWKGRVLWKLFGGLATILQNWISCNEQKMREAHITRRGTNFYLLIFIEKIINRKIEHSLLQG